MKLALCSERRRTHLQKLIDMKKARGYWHSPETRQKISKARKGQPAHNKGKPMSEAQKLKLSSSTKGRAKPSNWRGGTWQHLKLIALKRDNYSCRVCGLNEPEILEGAHVKPVRNTRTIAGNPLNLPSNVITLCPNDHKRFDKGLLGDICL